MREEPSGWDTAREERLRADDAEARIMDVLVVCREELASCHQPGCPTCATLKLVAEAATG